MDVKVKRHIRNYTYTLKTLAKYKKKNAEDLVYHVHFPHNTISILLKLIVYISDLTSLALLVVLEK